MKTKTIRIKDLNRLACFLGDLHLNEIGRIYFKEYACVDDTTKKELFKKVKSFNFIISPKNNDSYIIEGLQESLKKYITDLKDILINDFYKNKLTEDESLNKIKFKNMINNDSFLNIKYRNILKENLEFYNKNK